jgi:WD40 repeat protein
MSAATPEKLKATKQHGLKFIALALARQAKTGRLFLGGSDFKVYALDPASEKADLKEVGKHDSYVTGLAAAGDAVVSGGYDGRLCWWDADKSALVRAVEAHTKWVRNVAASPDGKLVASVADDMVCKVYDSATGKLVHELRGHKEKTPTHFPSMLFACCFSADGRRLATGDKVGHVVVWDIESGKPVTTLESPGMYTWDGRQRIHSIGGIRGLSFSPDGKRLAVGGIGKIGNVDHLDGPARVEVLEVETGKQVVLFEKTKFKGIVNRLAFHPEGDWVVGAGGAGNGFLIFFDLKANKVVKEEAVKFHVHAIAVGEGAETLYAAGHQALGVYEMKG